MEIILQGKINKYNKCPVSLDSGHLLFLTASTHESKKCKLVQKQKVEKCKIVQKHDVKNCKLGIDRGISLGYRKQSLC